MGYQSQIDSLLKANSLFIFRSTRTNIDNAIFLWQ